MLLRAEGVEAVEQLTGDRAAGRARAGRVPSGFSGWREKNVSPESEPLPLETVWVPPPVWNRTYDPLPSKFWPSPARPTIVYQNSL